MKKFTLIGHPRGHSMSPMIHDGLFKLRDKNSPYDLTDIAPEKVAEVCDNA